MSRHDLDGFFWTDEERVSKKGVRQEKVRAIPPIPDTGWRPPSEFPNLAAAKLIAVDTETYDPDLTEKGPGVRRGAYIAGLAVGTEDGHQWYFPMRHQVGAELNFDPDQVMRWAKHEFSRPSQPKVGASLLYDADHLGAEGVILAGPWIDIQVAEPLLDENERYYSLDAIASRRIGSGKVGETDLYTWSATAYGGKATRKNQADNIWRCPPQLVGPYAEGDVRLPIQVWEKQSKLIDEEGLRPLFELECRLLPLLLKMRQRGVRVDVAGAERVYEDLSARIKHQEKRLGGLDVYSGVDLARYCKKYGIHHPYTPKGNPSFKGEWLEKAEDPRLRAIVEVRKYYKARDTFIKGYILDQHVNGRLHCLFHPLRSDEGGAVSGRFSSSNPNLQNIPSRDPELGPMIRRLYLPEEGELWGRLDWSQIEFRLLTHYASGDGADRARQMYNEDPTTDFHQMTADLTGIDRKPAKNINFGLLYGMGEELLAKQLGRSLEDVRPIFATYHERLPFVKTTSNKVAARAAERGFIRTLLERKRRFDEWEPARWGRGSDDEDSVYALRDHAAAVARWGKVRRAFTHAALNALLQGGAADIMKKAMDDVDASEMICRVLGAPMLTVHDELAFSVPDSKEGRDALREVRRIMENVVKLRVPITAAMEIGPNWAEVKEYV